MTYSGNRVPRHAAPKTITPVTNLTQSETGHLAVHRTSGFAVAGAVLTAGLVGIGSAASAAPVAHTVKADRTKPALSDTAVRTIVSTDADWNSGDEVAVKAAAPTPVATTRAAVDTPAASRSQERSEIAPAAAAPAPAPLGASSSIVATAMQYVGSPYVYGGTSPAGFDCSGFTQYVFGLHGISLPRTSQAQAGAGVEVPMSQAQPGDLVIMRGGGHVAIYLGGGQIVHAGTPASGVNVSTTSWDPGARFIRVG